MTRRTLATAVGLWLLVASAIAAGVLAGSLLADAARAASPVSIPRDAGMQMTILRPASRPAQLPGPPTPSGGLTTDRPSPVEAGRTSGPDRYPTRSAALAAPVAGAAAISGIASWYCLPGRSSCTAGYPPTGKYAAAGPALRTGNWRGRTVTVTAGGRSVEVMLVDWCACPHADIDLYSAAFRAVCGPLALGLCRVEVTP